MKHSKATKLIFLFCSLIFVGINAKAQTDIVFDQQGSFRNMIYDNLNRDMARHDAKMRENSGKKKKTSNVSLNYFPSSSTRTEVIKKVAKDMGHGDANKADALEQSLTKDNLVNSFNEKVKEFGFNINNLPDALATYVLLNWQIVTGKDPHQYAEGATRYRDALKYDMQQNRTILGWDNAKRQRICESMALYAIMAFESNKSERDQQKTNNIRQTAINITGIDVAKYNLTNEGFIKI